MTISIFPVKCCHKVSQDVSADHLTFAEPLACAMHSVNRGKIKKSDRVLVTGCGPMGLLATVAAVARGASVHVTDLKRSSIEAATAVGAQQGYVNGEEDTEALANTFDVVIEASGSPQAYNLALDCVRKQGTISILSLIQPSDVPINLHLNALKEVVCVGSILFTNEFADALELIEAGSVNFEAITAARYPVSETQAACELMAEGRATGKVLIKPE